MTIYEQAAEAAAHWQGHVVRLISNRENAVFEMATPAGRSALRLHRMGYQNPAAIQSELWWCAALADAGVPVPRPLQAVTDDSLLVTLSGGRLASSIAWAEGTPLGEGGQPFTTPRAVLLDQHFALGQLLAKMHSATDQLTLPDWFTRPRWDAAGLVGNTPFWGRFWEHPVATPAQKIQLQDIRNWLQSKLADHATTGNFGPIHADVLRENILVSGLAISLIDFDDSGFGFRLFDLGTAMLQNIYEPAYPEIRDAMINGYSTLRAADRDTVEMFTLARACASVGWTMPRLAPDDPIHKSHIARCLFFADKIIR
jgi:Ser/Thr protein kinase RdoA (MazF antagonist)